MKKTMVIVLGLSLIVLQWGCGAKAPTPTTPGPSSPTYTYPYLFSWYGTGTTTWTVYGPDGIWYFNNTLFVTDTDDLSNNYVQKFDTDGNYLGGWSLAGNPHGFQGIAVDSTGLVYVSDNQANLIYKYDVNGDSFGSLGGPGSTVGLFNSPALMAIDSSNNLYVADSGNHRVQKWNGSTWTAFGTTGAQVLTTPWGVAVGGNGNIYVTDTAVGVENIKVYDPSLNYSSSIGVTLYSPRGLVVDSDGNLLVCDNGQQKLKKISPSGTYIQQVDAAGPKANGGDLDIAIDPNKNIYVTDFLQSSIDKYAPY